MKIAYIALNTFRESVRDKVLYNLVLFALFLIGCSLILGELSIGQEVKIIIDLGLTSISLVGGLMAVFIGIGLVTKEIDRRTIYTIVSKPVERHQFLLGKFLGLLLTLAVNVSLMLLGVYAALFYLGRQWVPQFWVLLPAALLIFAELTLVTAWALFFSTFSSPVLSAAFTLSIWVAGHFNADFKHLADLMPAEWFRGLCTFLYYLLPNFGNFDLVGGRNVIQAAGHLKPLSAAAVGMAILYGLAYTAAVIGAAVVIFRKRDFK